MTDKSNNEEARINEKNEIKEKECYENSFRIKKDT